MRENRLKRLLRAGQPALGVWSAVGSAVVAEALGELEADWILLDSEHGLPSYEDCLPLLQALRGSQATPVVRLPGTDPGAVRRVLDLGAEGVLIPGIKTADEVREVVAACRYPPAGSRGIGPFRAARYYLEFEEYYRRANDEIAVVVQIETRQAVANLTEILAVEGVDALFIGPADLSAALGEFPRTDGPLMRQTVQDVLTSCRDAGTAAGYYCNSGKQAHERLSEGFLLVNVGLDLGVLTRGFARELRAARQE